MEDSLGNVVHRDTENVDPRVSIDTANYIPLDLDCKLRAKGIATLLNDLWDYVESELSI